MTRDKTDRECYSVQPGEELGEVDLKEDDEGSDFQSKNQRNFFSKLFSRIFKKCKKGTNHLLYRLLYPAYYKHCARKPIIKDRVVFVEPHSAGLSNSLTRLYEYLVAHTDYHVETLLLGQLRMRYARRAIENFSVIKQLSTAEYIFVANSFPLLSSCPLRDETRFIQTWHGCGAFKRFGFSIGTEPGKKMKNYDLYKLHSNYTYVCVSGDEAVRPYADAMNLEDSIEKIKPVGVSRTDCFWDDKLRDAAFRKLSEAVPAAKGKKIILYLPTYRGKISHAKYPKYLDLEKFGEQALKNDYILLIKRHPFVKKQVQIPEGFEDSIVDVTDILTIEDLIFTGDICISDYSSVVFEFAIQPRPIIFFVPDLEAYYNRRGFYYDFEEFVCGPICKTTDELVDEILNIDSFDLEKVRDFKQHFMNGCDGHSTERILNLAFEDSLKMHMKAEVVK